MADGLITATSAKIAVTSASILAAVAVSSLIFWFQQRKKAINKVPTKWRPVGKVQHMFIYPLKSAKANEINNAECTQLGLKEILPEGKERFPLQDRYFMVYQENSQKFLTARQKHILLLVSVKSRDVDTVTLIGPDGVDEITFKVCVASNDGSKVECSMHSNEKINVADCGNEVAAWLSKIILNKDSGLRLGYYPDKDKIMRSTNNDSWKDFTKIYKNFDDSAFGAFSDIASYMLASQNSLDDLNKRLEPNAGTATIQQFRPNIVVNGSEINPYDEDNWEWIKIGDNVVIRGFKPCTRCSMVTLDPDKGVANPTKEPLVTLKKYRLLSDPKWKALEGDSPVFGRYFKLYKKGNISVGDTIYIQDD